MKDKIRGRAMSVSDVNHPLMFYLHLIDQTCFFQSVTPILGIPSKKGLTTIRNDDDKMTLKDL